MPYLFTYGTLQDPYIQQRVFGRSLKGGPDVLNGFRISPEKIMGRYLVAEETKGAEDRIEGVVYELEQNELTKADQYEGAAYKKKKVGLKSGKTAWVYIRA
ncbi:gamma-glutamylcyclotransferase family protein [Zobellia russellii]|uniref:gamma-glutamylcyclotransferase family protein n=1 Tax=Zobellia russellii TaxID=248907 RepID=UPI001BFF4AD1|nr:gamma-glutamylcyclotransferase family protein [Zobellia russellii]MBT9187318.1 gamma-glutamylcyclotransferase [Zobellia russellii]